MAINTNSLGGNILDQIQKVILDGIKKEVEREFDDAKARAIERLETRKVEIIAGIMLTISKTADFKFMEDRIIFTIRELTKDTEKGLLDTKTLG